MRGVLLSLFTVGLLAGCSCQDTGITGEPDAHEDPVPEPGDEPEPPCWDRDGDGYEDEACGGDDCDDSDPAIHPGADDVCLDGVDRDCDGIVDGPMLMGDVLQLSRNIEEDILPPFSGPIWTSSSYAIAWAQIEEPDGEMVHHLAQLSPEGDLVIESPAVGGAALIDWTGSSFGLMRYEPNDIYFRLLDPLFVPLSEEVQILDDGEHSPIGTVWMGDSFLVCWVEMGGSWENAKCSRVSADGDVLGAPIYVTHLSSWGLYSTESWELEWTGSSLALMWAAISYDDSEETRDLFFSSWHEGGTDEGEYTEITSGMEWKYDFSMAWTGSELGVVWNPFHGVPSMPWEFPILFTTVDERGLRVTEDTVLEELSDSPDLGITWTGSEFGVMYYVNPNGLVFIRGDPAGGFGDRTVLHESPTEALDPAMAWSGSELGAAWMERLSGVRQLLFGRIGFCD
jgi:hypothetical protein